MILLKLEGMPTTCLNRSQCVIIESRAIQEVEGAMEAVNDFVKTAPTFIAKAQVIIVKHVRKCVHRRQKKWDNKHNNRHTLEH